MLFNLLDVSFLLTLVGGVSQITFGMQAGEIFGLSANPNQYALLLSSVPFLIMYHWKINKCEFNASIDWFLFVTLR